MVLKQALESGVRGVLLFGKSDATRLFKDFNVKLTSKTVDVAAYAKEILGPPAPFNPNSQWGLSELCERLLGRRISKEMQISDWEADLSDKQVCYAGLDAATTLLCGVMLRSLKNYGEGARGLLTWSVDVPDSDKRKKVSPYSHRAPPRSSPPPAYCSTLFARPDVRRYKPHSALLFTVFMFT